MVSEKIDRTHLRDRVSPCEWRGRDVTEQAEMAGLRRGAAGRDTGRRIHSRVTGTG